MSDLISRQAAIDHLKKRLYETALNNNTEHPYYEEMADNRVSVWLEEVPTIDPVKHGKWVNKKYRLYDGDFLSVFICSECGAGTVTDSDNYCSCCGAKMERSEE